MHETVKEMALRLWVEGLSAGQIAAKIPTSRNCVMGHVYRAGKKLLAETGVNPYARPDQSINTRNGLRHPAGARPVRPSPKERRLKVRVIKEKPPQIKREIKASDVAPGDRLPPLVKLDERLWISLPGCEPETLMSLGPQQCKWPVEGCETTLFCGAKQADNSSYCPTHHRWGHSRKPLAPLNFNKRAA